MMMTESGLMPAHNVSAEGMRELSLCVKLLLLDIALDKAGD